MPRLPLLALILAAGIALPALAQNGGAHVSAGAATITEQDVRRHIFAIAADSMGGRDTPSRGLELTADYVAAELRRAGFAPGGDSGTYLQRYPITTRQTDGTGSYLEVSAGGASTKVSFQRDARWTSGPRQGRPITGGVLLLGGTLTPAEVAAADVTGRIVLYAIDYSKPLAPQQAALDPLFSHGIAALLLVSNRDSALFEERVRSQFIGQVLVGAAPSAGPVVVEVHQRAFSEAFATISIDVEAVRGSATPIIREVPSLAVTVTVADAINHAASAPNVVGILEGTDPVLKQEYVVFSAHMDHVGTRPGVGVDSIWNGADDDASGTTGVIELAEAFSAAPPRRSIILLTVSGEEKGLWGSDYFAGHPPVPIERMVADLNMDMIGRNWKDTIAVIGKEHSDLGATLDRVNAAHPELGMRAIDDIWPQESFYVRSDHYNFARRGVPVLFFFNGTHADYHEASDSPEKIDAEKLARIAQLVFYIGQDVANAAERPRWIPESYRRIVSPKE